MNAYTAMQTSGIDWTTPIPPPLYRSFQERPPGRSHPPRPELIGGHEEQMAGYASRQSVLNEARRHFVLPADSSVVSLLADHPATGSVLLEAAPRLKQYFGATTILKLRAPIDESGMRTLYVVVIWPGKIQDVRNMLAEFDADWWLTHSPQTSEHIVFTYELV